MLLPPSRFVLKEQEKNERGHFHSFVSSSILSSILVSNEGPTDCNLSPSVSFIWVSVTYCQGLFHLGLFCFWKSTHTLVMPLSGDSTYYY